ncbi:hypothetical protein L615_001900000700 [Nocardioides sp. J9]|uniref:DUF5701 family protein n=1 Tax=Nocardioides sp. J9 TaxID=935844 RepID=UPI0011A81795|nr:DUF5701 family protein [Nocardioides sp. J9]TWH01389.1 hypothetical protein L615_001900000700 [Nocardioides sp. J9]
MTLSDQLQRLVDLGLPALADVTPADLATATAGLDVGPGDVLAVHPALAPPSALAPLLSRQGKQGFVVHDMTDLDDFHPTPDVVVPDRPLYVVSGVDRGDDMANWSPEEAAPAIARRGRTPLTISEGISWLLQQPEVLEPNRCFMCIGSRKPRPKGYDARTPALWISGGTGHDGPARRNAPKVGWCWWRNRHTWLGFASAAGRH